MAAPLDGTTVASMSERKRIAFIFPMASGHLNPSLPVARSLISLGHEVHYLCREQMREVIEDTGSTFHSDIEYEPELYEGREPDIFGAIQSLKKEHDIEDRGALQGAFMLTAVQQDLMLPGVLRFLRELRPNALVFCPLLNPEAALASCVLGIPAVALLTTAGPGSVTQLVEAMMGKGPHQELEQEIAMFGPNLAAIGRLNMSYGLNLEPLALTWLAPLGRLPLLKGISAMLVTTSEDLQDPMSQELQAAYDADGVSVSFVGPLLDEAGARRASGHKYNHDAAVEHTPSATTMPDAVALVQAARASGRSVVLVSMGTVITGDSDQLGWDGRTIGPDGKARGLTGRELCQAAWAGAFDAFGSRSAREGSLLVVALGPQPNALGELVAPPNAVCMPTLPQVDILKAGVDVFLTHGGQNSFTESLACATPVVVCPGFGDQVVNAQKAVDLGVGLKVDRPDPDNGEEAAAAAAYRADVCRALTGVLPESSFAASAARCAERLRQAGGVPRAVEVVLRATTEAGATCAAVPSPTMPTKAAEKVTRAALPATHAGA